MYRGGEGRGVNFTKCFFQEQFPGKYIVNKINHNQKAGLREKTSFLIFQIRGWLSLEFFWEKE